MRSLRLLLLVMMLAFLPLPGWAGALAHAVGTMSDGLVASAAAPAASAADDMAGDAEQAAPADAAPAPESSEPQPQPGADLAEQLLPASPLRLAAWAGRSGPPRYAGAPLPEPDLPLLPRPPRA